MKQVSVNFWDSPHVRYGFLVLSLVAAMLVSNDTWATGSAAAGLTAADSGIRGMWPTVKNIMLVVMGIMGLIGAGSVYSKWSNGDPDTRKAAASWFGALIFAGLVITILSAVFGLPA